MEDHPKRHAKKNIRKRKIKFQRHSGDTKIPPKPSSSCSMLPDTAPNAGGEDFGDEGWTTQDHKPNLDTPTPKDEDDEEEDFAGLNAVYHGHVADIHRKVSTSPAQRQVLVEEPGQQWEEQHHSTYHGLHWQHQQSTRSPEISTAQAHTMVNAVPQMYSPYEDMDHFIHNSSARPLYHSSHTHPIT
ncbi:hypothetical protein LTR10_014785 [Elasticomyces elasticus]|uniref:MADS-box domain-containing protein n=1 Tax=Exophiala sideris TaxID=1016849 RepID=A0ABR0JGL6_9EURO|nr:hypothetical protein LTR10_014785 [Elasticomyces elasticus]KAK5025628.1 hypothetical protein LTS07_007832 [Exophiala sideris]KAK5063647.1 hypothetical protein LTR69_004353 [Exophiala sideris]KAK5180519.1 hypothetical protein LTR44_006833 [Eurotiomycetes sp. CCFEE 6388]